MQNKKINTIIIIIKTIIRNEVYLYISSCTIVNNIYHVTINFMSFISCCFIIINGVINYIIIDKMEY